MVGWIRPGAWRAPGRLRGRHSWARRPGFQPGSRVQGIGRCGSTWPREAGVLHHRPGPSPRHPHDGWWFGLSDPRCLGGATRSQASWRNAKHIRTGISPRPFTSGGHGCGSWNAVLALGRRQSRAGCARAWPGGPRRSVPGSPTRHGTGTRALSRTGSSRQQGLRGPLRPLPHSTSITRTQTEVCSRSLPASEPARKHLRTGSSLYDSASPHRGGVRLLSYEGATPVVFNRLAD